MSRFARERVRRIMRGYRRLRAGNRLSRIVDLKEALTNTRLTVEAEHASARIFGEGRKGAETIIRQYLLFRVGGYSLNRALLASLGGGGAVIHPLPARWRQIVREQGFAVAGFRSAAWWYAYVVLLWLHGLRLLLGGVFSGLREAIRPSSTTLGRYAYFDALTSGNLPQPGVDGRSHDILSWYLQWPGRAPDLDALAHGVKSVPAGTIQGCRVIPLPHPIPPLAEREGVLRFLAWGLGAGGYAALDLLRGRWWHALLLGEAVKAAQARLCNPVRLARDYLFHNSNWIYRPLWTYEAAARGSRILFYFYSTNCESFKTPGGYPIQANSWQAMNWPRYLVWDEGQAEFVRRAVGEGAQIHVVGSIWFHSSAAEIPSLPPRAIAVFDVQPVRTAFYRTLGLALDYYTPETATRFLGDIHDVARSCGTRVALKRKRQIGRLAHPAYRRFVESLDASPDFIAIDPDTSALRVIEKSAAVISLPFTSTALIARELNKPTCYYDPTGIVQKDDRAAHGIAIISGRAELTRWLCAAVAGPGEATDHTQPEVTNVTEKTPGMDR